MTSTEKTVNSLITEYYGPTFAEAFQQVEVITMATENLPTTISDAARSILPALGNADAEKINITIN